MPKPNTICSSGFLGNTGNHTVTVTPKRCNRNTSRVLWQQRLLVFVRTMSGFYSRLYDNIKGSTSQPCDIFLLEKIKPVPSFLFCSILLSSLVISPFEQHALFHSPCHCTVCWYHIVTFGHSVTGLPFSLSACQEEQL